MGSKSTDLLQCSHAVSVVAADDDRVSQGVTGHLDRAIEGIRVLSRSSSDEACLLIVVNLRSLNIPYRGILEVAQDIHQEIWVRYMVGIKGCNDLVPAETNLIEPGIVVP